MREIALFCAPVLGQGHGAGVLSEHVGDELLPLCDALLALPDADPLDDALERRGRERLSIPHASPSTFPNMHTCTYIYMHAHTHAHTRSGTGSWDRACVVCGVIASILRSKRMIASARMRWLSACSRRRIMCSSVSNGRKQMLSRLTCMQYGEEDAVVVVVMEEEEQEEGAGAGAF